MPAAEREETVVGRHGHVGVGELYTRHMERVEVTEPDGHQLLGPPGKIVDVRVGAWHSRQQTRYPGRSPGERILGVLQILRGGVNEGDVPTRDRAMVDAGLKAFSTDKPFAPEPVERPGIEYGFAGDEHGRPTVTDPSRVPRLGERIEFFPPHCDPTINLYDRIYAVRAGSVEAVWDISARGRSD